MKDFRDNTFIKYLNNEYIQKVLKKQVLNYYKNSNDKEIKSIISYINRNGMSMFNYDFVNKYKRFYAKIMKDNSKDLFYVMYNDKKMYFSRNLNSIEKAREYYKGLCVEQDKESPHCYLNDNFNVEYGDTVIDIGAAEGNFSLEIIDKVKKLYIFEYDDTWIEALKATFEPYKHKVRIIKKYVSNTNNKKSISLDEFFKNKKQKVDFIKMDIEGEEPNALKGAVKLLKNNTHIKLAVCAYHNIEDEDKIKSVLKEVQTLNNKGEREVTKYNIEANGYMLFLFSKKILNPPYLTRGVLRIKQNSF